MYKAELTLNERPRHRFISMTFFNMNVRKFNPKYSENESARIVRLLKEETFAVYAEMADLNRFAQIVDNVVSPVVNFSSKINKCVYTFLYV